MQPFLSYVNLAGPGVSIIYCRTKKVVDEIVSYLRINVDKSRAQSIRPFHSDLSPEYRNKTLQMLKAADELKVVVATDALGMVSFLPLNILLLSFHILI